MQAAGAAKGGGHGGLKAEAVRGAAGTGVLAAAAVGQQALQALVDVPARLQHSCLQSFLLQPKGNGHLSHLCSCTKAMRLCT